MDIQLNSSKEDIVMWAVCSAIGSQHELIDKMNNKMIDGKVVANIEFNVGGVNLDFRKVMKAVEQNIDTMVENRAKELIKERFQGLHDTLQDFENKILCESNKFNNEYE